MKCNCLCGCEVNLSLCLYLQMHTFERSGRLWLLQCNWCWHQHGSKSLQSTVRTAFDVSTIHNRYLRTLWRPWTYIGFYKTVVYDILNGRFIIDHKGPQLDHIVSRYNSAHIFINFSLILHCIACCEIHPMIIIHIFKDLDSDPKCFPQSVRYIIYWTSSINFHMQNLIQNFYYDFLLSFSEFCHLFYSWNCVCKFLSSSTVISSFLYWS